MDIISQTLSEKLRQADPNTLADVLREGAIYFRNVLLDISAIVTETQDVDASLNCTLDKVPLGPVVCMFTETTSHVPMVQVPQGETLGADEFSIDYDTRIVTAGGTVSSGEELTFVYAGLTAGASSGTQLAEQLAKTFDEL